MDRQYIIKKAFYSELTKVGFLDTAVGEAASSGLWDKITSTLGPILKPILHDTAADAHIMSSAADPALAAKLSKGVSIVDGKPESRFPLISPAFYSLFHGGGVFSKPAESRTRGFAKGLLGGLGVGSLTHGINLLATGASAVNPMVSLPILGLSALLGGLAGAKRAGNYQHQLALSKLKSGKK